MEEVVRLHRIIEKDGELVVTDLPYKKGQHVEITVSTETRAPRRLTAKQLLESGLVGLWQDRDDITNSVEYARRLREEAQKR